MNSFVEVGGAKLHLLEGGEGDPLLFLHGAGSAGQWSPFLEALAGRYHVLAPVHPGFGQSGRPDWVDRVDDVAFLYMDLLDELGVERMFLMGHSVGGWIAAALATLANHRVRKLVLADSAGIKPAGVDLPDLFALTDAQSAEVMVFDPKEREARINAKPTVEQLTRQISDRAALARLAWNPYLHDPKLPFRLHRASMPCLLVWGKHDGLFPVKLADAWLEHLPDARLVVVDQAGHNPMREQGDQVAKAVLEFLAEGER